MKQDVLKIINRLRDELQSHVVLTREERFHIFNAIQRAAEKQNSAFTAGAAEPIVSPLSEKFITYKRPFSSHIFFMSKASIALVVMCLVGGSVSLAAEQSLPGDTLYTVKTNFNEGIQSLVTFSPASRAKLSAELVGRRLGEARQLALTDPAAAAENNSTLEASFKKYSQEFRKNLIEVQSSDVAVAADLAVGFKATLKAHESTLAAIGTGGNRLSLDGLVTKEVEGIVAAEAEVQAQFSRLVPFEAVRKVEQQEAAAEKYLADFALSVQDQSSGEASVRIDEYIIFAEAIMADAEIATEAGRYADAFALYQQAISSIETARETLRASAVLDFKQEQTTQAFNNAVNSSGDVSLTELEALEAALDMQIIIEPTSDVTSTPPVEVI